MGRVRKMWPINSLTRYVDSAVNDNTNLDSVQENNHEASGLYCCSETTGKVKPVRFSLMDGGSHRHCHGT